MPEDVWIALLLRVTVFIGCASPLALLLHRCGLVGGRPAAALTGGILAGILLGPGGVGAIAPEAALGFFKGGQIEHKALFDKDLEHDRERAAQAEIGASPEAMSELIQRQEAARAPLVAQLERARGRTHLLTGSVMVALVGLGLGGVGWGSRAPAGGAAGSASVVGAAAIAVCVVVFAALPTALVLQWLIGPPLKQAVAIGAVVAAGSLFAAVPLRWMRAAGRDPITRRVGFFMAIVAAAGLAWAIPPGRLAFLLVPAVAVGIGTSLNLMKDPGKRVRRIVRGVGLWVCVPACAAYLAREVDGSALLASWQAITLVLVAIVTAGAGHFIGCYLGIQTFGSDQTRGRAAQHAIELLASGIGLTQLCFAVVFFAALPDAAPPVILAMLLANALAIEVQAPLNRRAISTWIA